MRLARTLQRSGSRTGTDSRPVRHVRAPRRACVGVCRTRNVRTTLDGTQRPVEVRLTLIRYPARELYVYLSVFKYCKEPAAARTVRVPPCGAWPTSQPRRTHRTAHSRYGHSIEYYTRHTQGTSAPDLHAVSVWHDHAQHTCIYTCISPWQSSRVQVCSRSRSPLCQRAAARSPCATTRHAVILLAACRVSGADRLCGRLAVRPLQRP